MNLVGWICDLNIEVILYKEELDYWDNNFSLSFIMLIINLVGLISDMNINVLFPKVSHLLYTHQELYYSKQDVITRIPQCR